MWFVIFTRSTLGYSAAISCSYVQSRSLMGQWVMSHDMFTHEQPTSDELGTSK